MGEWGNGGMEEVGNWESGLGNRDSRMETVVGDWI